MLPSSHAYRVFPWTRMPSRASNNRELNTNHGVQGAVSCRAADPSCSACAVGRAGQPAPSSRRSPPPPVSVPLAAWSSLRMRLGIVLNPLLRFVYDAVNLGWLWSYTRTATQGMLLELVAWAMARIAAFCFCFCLRGGRSSSPVLVYYVRNSVSIWPCVVSNVASSLWP